MFCCVLQPVSLDLPTDFDWRTDPRAEKCPSIKEIRDQSSCGPLWLLRESWSMMLIELGTSMITSIKEIRHQSSCYL